MLSQNRIINKVDKITFIIASATIFCVTVLIYSGALDYDYVSDDRVNIVKNYHIHGISLENILWSFNNALGGHYQPFTWLSYMLDYEIWGQHRYGYRQTNIVLHSINAILLMSVIYIVLSKLYSPIANCKIIILASSIGALFFSLHPLRVESVVWLTERRDVLSSFFLLVSFISYFNYSYRKEVTAESLFKKHGYYISFTFFLFSLLSKAWAITYPAVLVIINIALEQPKKRLTVDNFINYIKDKIPFIICSAIFIAIGIVSAGSSGAMISWEKLTIMDRVLQATYGFNVYLLHTIYPIELSPLYLLGNTHFLSFKYILNFIIFISIFIMMVCYRKKLPGVGYLFLIYLIIISPVLGFAQSGPQMLADRYTYIALMPFSFALSWMVLKIILAAFNQNYKKLMFYSGSLLLIFFLVFSFLVGITIKQIKIWENEGTLWTHAIKVDPENILAINNRADYKSRKGMYEASIEDYSKALSLNDSDAYALNGRAASKIYLGNLDGALSDLNTALGILPTYVDAILNRGVVYNNQGKVGLAKNDFEKVVELEPGNLKGNFYLGIACFLKGELHKAIELFTKVYYLNSEYIDAIYYRGLSYAGLNNINDAKNDFEYILNKSNQELTIYKNVANQLRLLNNG